MKKIAGNLQRKNLLDRRRKSTEEKLKNLPKKNYFKSIWLKWRIKEEGLKKKESEAFEFGGFNFAKESLPLLDNIDRATLLSFQK